MIQRQPDRDRAAARLDTLDRVSRTLVTAVLAALLVVACAAAPAPSAAPATPRSVLGERDTRYTIRHDTVLRTYVLHAPPGAEARTDLPVVVMLHADGSTSEGAIALTGWSAKADREGFIVAYPQADRGVWNDGTSRGLAGRVPNGDVGFIGAVLTDVDRHFKTDPARLYVTGFSTGASLAWLAGAELGHRLAAVAPFGGQLWPEKLNIARGVSLLQIAPGADPQYPLAGGRAVDAAGLAVDLPPVARSRDRWVNAERCQPGTPLPGPDGVKVRVYRGCRDGAEALFYDVEGLGHVWPGGPTSGGLAGADRIDATALIWEFFRTHPRP